MVYRAFRPAHLPDYYHINVPLTGISMYRLRQERAIGQSTYYKLKDGTGNIDTRTINKLCKILECQPEDLLEYIPDEE